MSVLLKARIAILALGIWSALPATTFAAGPSCADVFRNTRSVLTRAELLAEVIETDFYYRLNFNDREILNEAFDPNGKKTFVVRDNFRRLLRNVQFGHPKLTKQVEIELGRTLTQEERVAVRLALAVGRGEHGRGGEQIFSQGRYRQEQMEAKDRVLDLAGFTVDERVMIMTNRLVEEHLSKQMPFNMFNEPRPVGREQAVSINDSVIREMNRLSKPDSPKLIRGRKAGLTSREMRTLYETVTRHPVARLLNALKYDKERNIGFCFGRATVGHIEALRMGVSKESIRKVFAVGKMKATGSEFFWQYHVGFAVRNIEGGWSVIDPFVGRAVSLEHWTKHFQEKDPEGTTRIFVTEASRLFPNSFYKYHKDVLDGYPEYFGDVLGYYREIAKNPELEQKTILVRLMNRLLSMIRLGV